MDERKIGLLSLTFMSLVTIIGSGWLFAAYYVSKISGGAAILAWVIGAIIVFILALSLLEMTSLFPKRGAMTRFVTITHGKDTGFIFALANWLGVLAVIPTEAVATTQYLMNLNPTLLHYFYNPSTHSLTLWAMSFTEIVMLIYLLLNFWGAKVFSRANNLIGIFKIIVPTITAIAILMAAYHPGNFTLYQGSWMPYGPSSIFTAIIGAGIIYAFNGFQAPLAFCAEVKNLKHISMAILIALAFTTCLYILLQVAFIGALPESMIANGWHQMNFHSPLVQLSAILGLHVITLLLYIDSVVSPSGTGATYMGTTGRMLCAMSQEKQMPKFFSNLHPKYHFSRRAMLFNFILASALLLLFRSWAVLVTILSIFHVISYLSGPISNSYMRRHHNNMKRDFKMPISGILNPLLFVVLTLLIAFSRHPRTIEFSSLLTVLYFIYLYINSNHNFKRLRKRFSKSWYMLAYLWILSVIDLLAPKPFGGVGMLSNLMFYVCIVLLGLYFYYLLLKKGNFDIERYNKIVSE